MNLKEISDLAKMAGGKKSGLKSLGEAMDAYTTLFQFGPRTGTPVFTEFYARDMAERLASECKGGRLTNITSIRESRNYPVVKGEVVRIDALCVKR